MEVTATEAKNRLGQMLEHCQRESVVISKSGRRRHSVLISAAQDDRLVAARARSAAVLGETAGLAFYRENKAWVDEQNTLIQECGIPGKEHRIG